METPRNIQTGSTRSRTRNFLVFCDPAVWCEYAKLLGDDIRYKLRLRGYKEDYRIPKKRDINR